MSITFIGTLKILNNEYNFYISYTYNYLIIIR